MKHFVKIFMASLAMLFCLSSSAGPGGDGYDVFVPIAKYLGQGDAEKLSAWFADNLEITIMSTTIDSSKNQAKQILKSFFENHTPRSFKINHTASRSNSKYALGYLNAGGELFEVTIFVSNCKNTYKIQQLKIDRLR
ncbi:MAG: DUF4783 domain-containing protein [Bacteroidales bacterium]|jgi:hypothetical protein|nr:DUF4783 domain-containing protein [Bacteroidales bacterium]MBR5397315.1 DUF4783 domain-containing protein [Bacteroidales bacterium]